jgi:hypothetical protein
LVGWIRIQEGKNGPQKQEKVKKFYVLKCWMLRAEGFYCGVDIIHLRLKDKEIAI